MLRDLIRDSILKNKIVFCEEIARDGAQGKTLLLSSQRTRIAQEESLILGKTSPNQLVFAAGFPAICQQEYDCIQQVARKTTNCCQIMAVCRDTEKDVQQAIDSVAPAHLPRIMIVVPMSETMCQHMVHTTPEKVLTRSRQILAHAIEYSHNQVAIDICFADISRSNPNLLLQGANQLTQDGACTVMLADTIGEFSPYQTYRLFKFLIARKAKNVALGCHLHNDLGFGLANTFEAIRAGVRYVTSTWLGIAERSGLPHTEELIFALGYHPKKLKEKFGIENQIWITPPNLKKIVPLARSIAKDLNFPLRVNDPICGDGVNTISTGTPFVHPVDFMPYDAESILGVAPKILITQLVSKRVVLEAAKKFGFTLNDEQAASLTKRVKQVAYQRGKAQIPDAEFIYWIQECLQLTHDSLSHSPLASSNQHSGLKSEFNQHHH